MLTSSRFSSFTVAAGLVLVLLAVACASPPVHDSRYEVVHEGFGFRADLDGWQVYSDAASAPAMLRPAFGNKQGPDDPPLFVAIGEEGLLTAVVQRADDADSLKDFESIASGLAQHGVITSATRLASSDILFTARVGPASQIGLAHASEGRVVRLALTSQGSPQGPERFFHVLRGIELHGKGGWEAPFQLSSPIIGEALPGYAGTGLAVEDEDPFQAVDCPTGSHPLLWSLPGNSGRVYLFGSIHVGHPSFYPFAPAIESAFSGAERLAVEVDVSAVGEAELSQQMLEAGALPPGTTLSEVVPPEIYEQLQDLAAELGVPAQMFDSMRPGTAGLVISTLPYIARGFNPEDGVDLYFLGSAEGKSVVELETLEDQLALINSFDATFLHAALDGMETIDEDLEALHRTWRCGDEEGLTHTVFELSSARATTAEDQAWLEEFNEVFLFGRNERMAAAILDLLDEEGDTFVVIGAAHLLGERGIPALLREAGHVVDLVGSRLWTPHHSSGAAVMLRADSAWEGVP